ncbi:MAG TPA: hypothetical protein VJ803_11475 [Gemmatimonadaceae bacterium]|nr:hypothetical protein [Gemmatimonadaceae bacterium]
MSDEARERFLREIVKSIPVERIEEIRMFEPIRQGGKESGVALIAVLPDEPDRPPPPPADSWLNTDAPLADERDRPAQADDPSWDPDGTTGGAARRLVLYRGQYRHTLKGADRGKWEVEIVAEADAPIATVDDVVHGVQRRSGDDSEPERMTGDALRASLAGGPWTATP